MLLSRVFETLSEYRFSGSCMESAWQQYVLRIQWLQAICFRHSLRNNKCDEQYSKSPHACTRNMIPVILTSFFHYSTRLPAILSLCTQVQRMDRPSMLL